MRFAWMLAALAGMATAAEGADMPAVQDLLKEYRPSQRGVEYETPTDPAAVAACKVEYAYDAAKKPIGYLLRDGQGKILRKFVDAHKRGHMDQWSYYQDGFEVYREVDVDGDQRLDECRWMNAGGTRVGSIRGAKLVGWKRLSAEEAAKVLVQTLVTGDLALLETVMASSEELAGLGLPKGLQDAAASASEQRVDQIKKIQAGLIGWTRATTWQRLDCGLPRLIPADDETGLKQDLILYENAIIFAAAPNAPAAGKTAYLQAPDIVKIGDVWKFVELPRAVDPDPDKPMVIAADGGVRGAIFRERSTGQAAPNPELEKALKALSDFDAAHPDEQQPGADKKAVARFQVERIKKLRDVVKVAVGADDKLVYNMQVVDCLAAAYETGLYADGAQVLDNLAGDGGALGSYAAFRKISAEFNLKNDEPGANLLANQKAWVVDLKAFLDKFPKAAESPEALWQLASVNEFAAEEDEAKKYYERLAADFPETEPGRRAAGALKRLGLVGKPFAIAGAGLSGKPVDTSKMVGKTVAVVFWSTLADPVRRDLPDMTKLYQKYHARGFEIVGVALDNSRERLDDFLKQNPSPWPQIFEPGSAAKEAGMEKNKFAIEYGLVSLPTIVLVDADGKVVNRNLRSAADLERALGKILKAPGVAADVK